LLMFGVGLHFSYPRSELRTQHRRSRRPLCNSTVATLHGVSRVDKAGMGLGAGAGAGAGDFSGQ
jgi:hypothetical protein